MLTPGSNKMDNMINTKPILPAILALLLSGYCSADELTNAAQQLCERIKACTLEAVAGPDLTDNLRQQMEPVLEKNCAEMRNRVQAVPAKEKLHQPAVNCLRSMALLSCPQLYDSSEFKTPACAEYDRLANTAGAATP